MKITIVGAGNIGTQFAVHCAEKGHQVTIYTSCPEKIENELYIVNEENKIIHCGILQRVTNSAKEAFEKAELIIVCVPAALMDKGANEIAPFAYMGQKICLASGIGGGECAFKKCIDKGAVLFGLQRVPSVARLVEYGKTVKAVGYRSMLHVAAIPHAYTEECCSFVENLFDIPCKALDNYLNITLTPSNPILHTARLMNIFRDYKQGYYYDTVPLFYEEWDENSAKTLLACDEEVQIICKQLDMFDLANVKSLRLHYESETPQQLAEKLRSIESLKGLKTPVIACEQGLIPDFSSRYFSSDFLYGLNILIQIADIFSVSVPNMREVMNWYREASGDGNPGFRFANYGLDDCQKFVEFYKL
ncbi:MAG: NAD/NADP octopine/nopaline dehydrogenase family protein [Lachnospiraceae bacterium]